jgi:hypothetical protein
MSVNMRMGGSDVSSFLLTSGAVLAAPHEPEQTFLPSFSP